MAEEKKKKASLFNKAWDKTKQGVDAYEDSTARQWIRNIGDKKTPVVEETVEEALNKFGEWTQGGTNYAKGLFKGTSVEKHFKTLEKNSVTNAIGRETNRYVRAFLEDVHKILMKWYRDPNVLCCLIKLLAATGYGEEVWRGIEIKKGTALYDFKATLIFIRAILGIMISLARGGIRDIMISTFDLMAFLTTLSVGAVIIVINTFVEGLAQYSYDELSRKVANLTSPEVKKRLGTCLPFEGLMSRVLKFFIGDFGLIAVFKQYTLDFLNKLRKQQSDFMDETDGLLGKINDLDYLETMYDLLGEIIDALSNVEFCVEMTVDGFSDEETDTDTYRNPTRLTKPTDGDGTNDSLEDQATTNTKEAESGTNNQLPKATRTMGDLVDGVMKKRAENLLKVPTDNEMNSFMSSHLGLSPDQIAQQKADTGHVLDCGKTLTDEQYSTLNKIMSNLKK